MDTIRLPQNSPYSKKQLSVTEATGLLQSYWEHHGSAVWDLFDKSIDPQGHAEIDPVDLLSLTALNAQTSMRDLSYMWHAEAVRARVAQQVQIVLDTFAAQEAASLMPKEREALATRLGEIADELETVPYWGPTRVSKLMYRLLPRHACIWDDGGIRASYPDAAKDAWPSWFRRVHSDIAGNRLGLLKARNDSSHPTISLGRVWDILLWTQWKMSQI